MTRAAWLAKSAIPASRTARSIELPNDEAWIADFLGAFYLLCQAENWEQHGTLTPDEMADEWLSVFLDFEEFSALIIPTATVIPFAGSVTPAGWLICDGAAYNRLDYGSLFDAIGETYGPGDGSTTFNVPNLKGRVITGRDVAQSEFDLLGETGGQKAVTLGITQIPSHNHTQNSHNHNQNPHSHTQVPHSHTINGGVNGAVGSVTRGLIAQGLGSNNVQSENTIVNVDNALATNQGATATNQATGGGQSHQNLQPYLVLSYIIKT